MLRSPAPAVTAGGVADRAMKPRQAVQARADARAADLAPTIADIQAESKSPDESPAYDNFHGIGSSSPSVVVEDRPLSSWWIIIALVVLAKAALSIASHNDDMQNARRLQRDHEAWREEQLHEISKMERPLARAQRQPQQQQFEHVPDPNLPPGYERLRVTPWK